MSETRIPRTDSIEEMARFWDTHDLTDFEDELEEVSEAAFERQEGTVVTIHLRPEEAEVVQNIAKSKDVEQTTLIRHWILEKINEH